MLMPSLIAPMILVAWLLLNWIATAPKEAKAAAAYASCVRG